MTPHHQQNKADDTAGEHQLSRRRFVATTATATAAGAAAVAGIPAATSAVAAMANVFGSDVLKVGLIGCGGRGTGAATDALNAAGQVRIVALADLFPDRLIGCRNRLAERYPERASVSDDRCHTGFDAYKQLIASDVDQVILATPPHFRPMQFEQAIEAGKHVFMEKPVAVDPTGIRRVIAAGELAERKGLSVVSGTQRRHELSYLAAMSQIRQGAIGDIVAARCYWNMGGLWKADPRDEWSAMEWQIRNWLYFTWLSGDHIVEQHVHNLDAINWAMGGPPVRCMGMGGRQVRTDKAYGHVFDHFAIEYEYANGAFLMSMCRQTDGCASRVEERIRGTRGRMKLRPGFGVIEGEQSWRYDGGKPNPYVREHADLVASITSAGARLNEARRVAESTLTAIMGRMSAYTGQEVTWEQALNSQLDLAPPAYEFGAIDIPPVPMPGRTPLI